MNLCKHGVFIGLEPCVHCSHDHQFNLLKSSVKELNEHKLRQIDENRKISRRVDELQNHFADVINQAVKKVNDLDKFHQEFKDVIKEDLKRNEKIFEDIFDRIEKLETKQEIEHKVERIAELEKKVNGLEKSLVSCYDIEEIHRILKEHYKQIFHRDKKPHCCPVCDGKRI